MSSGASNNESIRAPMLRDIDAEAAALTAPTAMDTGTGTGTTATRHSSLTEAEARELTASLPHDSSSRQICGCYLVHCVCCFNLPIGCFINYEPCVGCMHTCGTFPFSCCVCLCRSDDNVWSNIKGDTHLMVVRDDYQQELACYWAQTSKPLCYCVKLC